VGNVPNHSEGLVVARVLPQDVIELNVVDFVGGTRLEPFVNQREFFRRCQQFLVIEDGLEASHGNEA
jgi:hypothetical protein